MKTSPHPGGRIWLAVVGLFLISIGSLFVSYLWGAYQRAALMDAWEPVPCRIESVVIGDDLVTQHYAPKFRLDITYRYEIDGSSHEGNRYKRLPSKSASRAKLERIADRYPVGSSATCFVDPENPGIAVLRKDSKGALYSIWFPGLFVAGGIGILLTALRPHRRP